MNQCLLDGFETEAAMAYKNCSQCGLMLPLERFGAKCDTRDGKRYHCRECERKRTLGRQRVIDAIADEILCTKCHVVKPQSEFQPSRITSKGRGWCKNCTKDYDRHQAESKKKQRQDRIDAGEIRQCKACHKHKPIQKFNLHALKCLSCYTRNSNSKLKNRLRNASTRAMDRGLSFDLTLEEYADLVSAPCTYCGGPLPTTGSGLDRIENDKGYSRMNCIPCCDACNTARGARWSVEQMVKFIGPAIRQARGNGGEVPRTPSNRKPCKTSRPKPEPWTAERFSTLFLSPEPQPKAAVLTAARAAGIGKDRTRDLLIAAEADGLAFVWWPPRGLPRVKHYANQPSNSSHSFCKPAPSSHSPIVPMTRGGTGIAGKRYSSAEREKNPAALKYGLSRLEMTLLSALAMTIDEWISKSLPDPNAPSYQSQKD